MEERPSPPSPLELTEDQKQRAEFNRLRALAKRKAFLDQHQQSSRPPNSVPQFRNPIWNVFKCRKPSSLNPVSDQSSTLSLQDVSAQNPDAPLAQRFRVRFEICSPDSFSIAPEAIDGFSYPGAEACFAKLEQWLSNVMMTHTTQNHGGGMASVYKLRDYEVTLKCLKGCKDIEIEEIPWTTYTVLEKFSHSHDSQRWIMCRPEHLPDEKVADLISKLPKKLLDTLMPFQFDGLRFGLRRGGRCLIADEMGLGKTLQAIAIASCFADEGPILVVCPAILRYAWAEELEHWLPTCLPSDIHLVCGHQNNPAKLARLPRVVVTSYTMLARLQKSMLEINWAVLIVDESHHVRCTRKKVEAGETKAAIDMSSKVKRVILLSGTPSLSRPGLLGKTKYEFAKTYCSMKLVEDFPGKSHWDFSEGCRLQELSVLLRQTVMIRRLKENLLVQLPPKRRQIIRLGLKKSDVILAQEAIAKHDTGIVNDKQNKPSDASDTPDDSEDHKCSKKLSPQELGIAKVSGFLQWLSLHPITTEVDRMGNTEMDSSGHKMIIFAHHHIVFDKIQEFFCDKGIGFVRIDGKTLDEDRQSAVKAFQSSNDVKVAMIGIKVGYAGINLSAAQSVAFVELPKEPTSLLQAEDRAHRQGQTKAVNVYIFSAMETSDESRWQRLNKSLFRVTSTTNGKYDAVPTLEVDRVSCLGNSNESMYRTPNSKTDAAVDKEKSPQGFIPESEVKDDADMIDEEIVHGTSDESRWQMLNKSLFRVTSTTNGKYDAVPTLEVDRVSCLGNSNESMYRTPNSKTDAAVDKEKSPQGFIPESEVKNDADMTDEEIVHGTPNKLDPNPGEPSEVGSSIETDNLRFEVSQYTGRIHLWACIPGVDSRPRPLSESFQPDEIISGCTKYASSFINKNPACREALLVFIDEWNNLRRVDKRKLFGKPLQLPLSVELSYLCETTNHDDKGLLKGGSKRRNTPLCEISLPLPPDAVWKQVLLVGCRKKDKVYVQAWSTMKEPLCKLCQNPCMSSNAKKPEFFEDLFCNLACSEEYRSRTSNKFLRHELFKIERGICTNCQLDCHKLVLHLRPLTIEKRVKYIKTAAPNLAKRPKLVDKLVAEPTEGNAWHADHYVPVYQGGGECRIENLRTLCVACHADVTSAQCAERKLARRHLNEALKKLRGSATRNKKRTRVKSKVQSLSSPIRAANLDEDDDEFLLVRVPGSAYTKDS